MKIKKLGGIGLIAFCVALAGCVSLPKSYSMKERPVYPKLGSSVTQFYRVINTLQPVLRWKNTKSAGQTYDVAMWKSPSRAPDESIVGAPFAPRKWGKQVFYVRGINANYYQVKKLLKPNTCYHWSVRVRTGTKVSKWATFSQTAVSPLGIAYAYHFPYGFITPKK